MTIPRAPRPMGPAAGADDIFGAAVGAPAAAPASGAKASAGDNRKDVRVKVKWAARVQLADGRVVPLRVCDISEGGIALAGELPITPHAVLSCAVAVPDMNNPAKVSSVVGTMRTAHVTVRGPDLVYGGSWVSLDPSGRDLIKGWIKRLRS